ncbi:MAG: AraC family transcriptional regulator [Longibaculum sp.]
MSNNRIDISKNDYFDFQSRLLYVTYSKYEGDWNSLMHFHPFSEIFYVLSGKGKFTVENNVFDVKSDDMIIVNPNIYHHEDSSGDDPLEYVVLGVEDLTFGLNEEDNLFLYQSFEKNNSVQYYISQLLMESENKAIGYEMVCQKLFDLFLLYVIRQMRLNLSSNPLIQPIKREIRMISYYIDQNYSDNITLESLAEYMKMNKYYMAHEFKRCMGVSPINYLIERRIKECKSLLTTTSLSIAEISETVGFSSQSYFSQMFKKNTGMTPKQYRDSFVFENQSEELSHLAKPMYQKKYIFDANK